MASRYLRATGNWNDPVWASTPAGAPGSAATPTSSDGVYMAAGFNLTLSSNAACYYLEHTSGTLAMGSHTLLLDGGKGFYSTGSTARTINLGSGTLRVDNHVSAMPDGGPFILSGANLTFNAGTSNIIINAVENFDGPPVFNSVFKTMNKAFNNVHINLGDGIFNSVTLDIKGSPTFRSIIVQSKNSAAHTVTFDSNPSATVSKFVAIGSSSASKLTIENSYGMGVGAPLNFLSNGSSYGQYVNMTNVYAGGSSDVPKYIGSNSVDTNFNQPGTWLLQDPPKISTLVDPLTTAPGSNPNWSATDASQISQVSTGLSGGGYSIQNNATLRPKLISSDTYDFVDSWAVVESIGATGYKPSGPLHINDTTMQSTMPKASMTGFFIEENPGTELVYKNTSNSTMGAFYLGAGPGLDRFRINSNGSVDVQRYLGGSWVNYPENDIILTEDEIAYFRSVRITLGTPFGTINGGNYTGVTVGSIGVMPEPTNNSNFLMFF